MSLHKATKELRKLLNDKTIQTEQRFVMSPYGEKHYDLLALFGAFTWTHTPKNDPETIYTFDEDCDSLCRSPKIDEIVKTITDAGYNAEVIWEKGRRELLVEVSRGYMMPEDKLYVELRKKDEHSFLLNSLDRMMKNWTKYKINKSW